MGEICASGPLRRLSTGALGLSARSAAAGWLLLAAATAWAAPPVDRPTIERPRVVETTFKSVDATVAAQWDFPTQSPAPLVVLIPTNGRIDRNGWAPTLGEAPEDGMYSKLTNALVRAGFAVFRYDKPGTGRSGRGHYSTERSSALEAYTRAVDHARVDPQRVFLLGHSLGTDSIASIYPRYVSVVPPAGVVLLDNAVGESDSLRIAAPLLIVNPGKDPDDRYQYGQFVVEARKRSENGTLETDLVIIDDADRGLLAPVPDGTERTTFALHPRADGVVVDWLRRRAATPSRARSAH